MTAADLRERCEVLHAGAADLLADANVAASARLLRPVSQLFELLRAIIDAIDTLERRERHGQ